MLDPILDISQDAFADVISMPGVNVVVFSAPWCGPCRFICKNIENSDLDNINFYKVSIDDNEDLVKKLEIRSVPTLMIYKDGKLVKTHVGAPKDIRQVLFEAVRTLDCSI